MDLRDVLVLDARPHLVVVVPVVETETGDGQIEQIGLVAADGMLPVGVDGERKERVDV